MTITASTATSTRSTTARPVWRAAALSGVVAAAATASIAALADVAGISTEVDGEAIPVSGFVTMTLAAVLVGYVLAIVLNRWAARPRRAFVAATVVMTAASFVPDLTFPMAPSTRVLLITSHIAAAAIVIPLIAARLNEQR